MVVLFSIHIFSPFVFIHIKSTKAAAKTSWEAFFLWNMLQILKVNLYKLANSDYVRIIKNRRHYRDVFEWFQNLFIWNVSVQEKIKQQYKY